MRFTVKMLRRADRDYNEILDYIAERSKSGATAWARALDKSLARLEESADTFPPASEDKLLDIEVREILQDSPWIGLPPVVHNSRVHRFRAPHSRIGTG